jgi:arylsulfatase A-like enzyme
MYEELLRVPLIFHGPGVAEGRRVPCAARHVDVVPTVLELLGLPHPSGLRGRSLVSLVRRDAKPEGCVEAPLVAESPAYGPDSRALTWRGHKLIARSDGVEFLFDLRVDPGERRNLADEDPRRVAALRSLLGWELAPATGRAQPEALGLDERTRRDLRALGYLR